MVKGRDGSAGRVAAGLCCLVVATISFAVLVLGLVPADPVVSQPGAKQLSVGSYVPSLAPESVVDVQFGSSLACDGIVRGKRFVFSDEEKASWTEDQLERMVRSDGWELRYEGLELAVPDAEVLDGEEFLARYPHYLEANPFYDRDREFKVVTVSLHATNGSAEEIALPVPLLWSRDFRGASDATENGLRVDEYALAEVIGHPQEGRVQLVLPDGWSTVGEGESRTIVLAYAVDKALFEYGNDYDSLDERDLCLSLSGYEPAVVYRLWLG